MTSVRVLAAGTLAFLAALCTSCASPPTFDYATYREHLPASILVLPPLDLSLEAQAPYDWLATITRPLAERGYYVFPVALVDLYMKENGLPTPYEMHAVPLEKLGEVFGCDAVLYVTITEWGTSFRVLSSDSVVAFTARLVDVGSGLELWSGEGRAVESSAQGQSNPIAMLATAITQQVLSTTIADPTRDLARQANRAMVLDERVGLLPGPHAPLAE